MVAYHSSDAIQNLGAQVYFEQQGRLCSFHPRIPNSKDSYPHENKAKRGEIKIMSAKARKRLIDLAQRIDEYAFKDSKKTPKFLTLTYGLVFPKPNEAKKHLKALKQRLLRLYPEMSGWWKMELQERGAPHFHLVLFGLPFLPFEELRAMWEDVIGWDVSMESTDHVFVRIESIYSYRKLTNYVSKYTAKMDDSSSLLDSVPYEHAGKWWGIINRSKLPLAPKTSGLVPLGKWFYQAKRCAGHIYNKIKEYKSEMMGFTIYLDQPDKFIDYIYLLIRNNQETYHSVF